MLEDAYAVTRDTVGGEAAKLKVDGYRLVTMTGAALDGNTLEILYHFDKALRLKHLRLTAARDQAVPSISAVYLAAFLVENEIQDLFGIHFEGLAVDYHRTLYLDGEAAAAPFCPDTAAGAVSDAGPAALQSGANATPRGSDA